MKYLGLDVRLDVATSRPVSERRLQFHAALAGVILGRNAERAGAGMTVPIGLPALYRTPKRAAAVLSKAVAACGRTDLALIDLSDNGPHLAREYFLVELIDAIHAVSLAGTCSTFVLLLPHSLGPAKLGEGLPVQMKLSTAETRDWPHRLLLIDATGTLFETPTQTLDHDAIASEYRRLKESLVNNAESQLRRHLVRRLGHYKGRSSAHQPGRCRRFSYIFDGPTDDLTAMLESQWARLVRNAGAIVFDDTANSWFSYPVARLGTDRGLHFFPVTEMTNRHRIFAKQVEAARGDEPVVLLVDVSDTGGTVARHLRKLESLGIPVLETVLAGIGSHSSRALEVGRREFHIEACIVGGQQHVDSASCPQCRLQLPWTPDHGGDDLEIGPYDFWDMATTVPWEAEPDVPPGRLPFEYLPDLNALIETYGDWIGYKLAQLLRRHGLPTPLIVYPSQAGAVAVAECLRNRLGQRVPLVSVPDTLINEVRNGREVWADVVAQRQAESWCAELSTFAGSTAITVDVLNASGGTARELRALLARFGITVSCHLPFVDRGIGRQRAGYECIAPYSWWGPE